MISVELTLNMAIVYLPWQKVPFPVYPLSHVQKNDPPMLVQEALE
jgi:hypothetical protein